MNHIMDVFASLSTAPLGTLLVLVALAAIGLAAYAIYVVHQTVKERARR
jgi:hypothetical protein